jgi:hypothetical protein
VGIGGQRPHPRLSKSVSPTPLEQCSLLEQQRRTAIQATRIYVVLYVNGQSVATSEAVPLQFPLFSAVFDMSSHLKVLGVPTSIICEVSSAFGPRSLFFMIHSIFMTK